MASSKSSERRRSRSPIKTKLRSKRLLVSNIPFNVSMKELKALFKEKIGICGQLDYIEKYGKFTGNATMEFKTLDGAQKAVDTMHKHEIDGREIIVREETNKDRDRLGLLDQKPIRAPEMGRGHNNSLMNLIEQLEREGPITNSLFMANLHYSLTWQKLKDMFKAAGRVRRVELKVESDGTSRGFGTVEFETPEEAVLAIHMFNNKALNGREIRLRMDKSGKHLVGRLDMSRCGDFGAPSMPSNSSYSPQIRRVFEDLMVAISNPSNNSNPQAMKALNELVALSQMFDKSQPGSRMPFDNGMPRNYDRNPSFSSVGPKVFNDFGNTSMFADNFMSQNFDSPFLKNTSFPSKPQLSSDVGRNYRDTRYSPPPKIASHNSSGISNNEIAVLEDILTKMKNTDQGSLLSILNTVLSKKPNESPNSGGYSNGPPRFNEFSTAQSNTLLVKNIPFSYTWKDLKHSFSQAPGIVNTEILRDDFNRSKGIGLVQFQSSTDAQKCKNIMDGTLLDGRPIHIEFSHSLK